MTQPEQAPAGVDPTTPIPARMYDYMLDGKHNFPADRDAVSPVTPGAGNLRAERSTMTAKPTVETLGIDVAAQSWQRSGDGAGSIEIAFVRSEARAGADWVLMRVAGDPAGRVLVYDMNEWACFLDGVRNGEFDDAAGQL